MPIYEYECEHCAHRFEVIQKFSDAPIAVCPKCGGGPVQKLLSSPAIQFKGSGFYLTDYGRSGGKDQGAPKANKGDGSSGGSASGDSKSSDSKSSESKSSDGGSSGKSDSGGSGSSSGSSNSGGAGASKPSTPAKSD